ncbi:hypothetical protein GGQ61_002713 [Phenylobacterium haematophilum]|uniref:Uncharacterized protein n=1 Tax=Phenylobacterium haematophilum TaxID=98513 RepID=A0A839ZZD9_9CAUL|nr:hypothetical protein [Phenylobacterium haematophilum]MBB3891985.1 hypothetical protein [Phenylobacterium haematophilum]
MSRFAVISAALLGVLFPLLETLRRGFSAWLTTPVTLLEDYVAGALLLWAAVFLGQRRPSGWVVMLAAAAYTTGMMSSSFWKQLEAQLTGETWEDNQIVVIGFKLLLWGVPLILTIISARAVLRQQAAR